MSFWEGWLVSLSLSLSLSHLDGVVHKTPGLEVVLLVGDPPCVALRVIALILLRNIRGDVSADWEFARWGLPSKGNMSKLRRGS